MNKLKGILTAIITPFKKDGALDWDAFEKLIERQIQAKIDGIVFAGTTGESPTLSHQEHKEILNRSVKLVDKRTKVFHNVGSNNTRECLDFVEVSQKAGADGMMAVSPYYNKPNQAGLFKHFTTIADHAEIPLMIYNIEGRTAVNIGNDTMLELVKHPKIAFVKEASGDLEQQTDLILRAPENISLFSGDDPNTLAFTALGGDGVVSVTSNVIPKTMRKYMYFCLNNQFSEARVIFKEIYPLMKTLMSIDTNPLGVKEILAQMGWCEPTLRMPLIRISEEKRDTIKLFIKQVQQLEHE